MEQKEIRFRQKRDLSLIISDSFEFLKQEAQPLLRMVGIYVLPFIVVYAGAQIYFQRNILSHFDFTNQETLMTNIGPFYKNLFLFMFFGLFVQSLLTGTYYTYLEAYIKKGKGNFQISDISSKFFTNSLLALGANIVFAVIVFCGAMFCLVPGIYLANTLSLLTFIFIFERKGLNDAFGRSWKLVNTQWWNTLLINVIGVLLVWAVGIVISLPAMAMGLTNNLFSSEMANPADYPTWYWAVTGLSSVVKTTLMIIPITFQAFQYFNLDERENPVTKLNQEQLP